MRQIFTTLAVVCGFALAVSLVLLVAFPAEKKDVWHRGALGPAAVHVTRVGLSDLELHHLGYEILKSTVQLALTGFVGGMLLQMYSRRNAEKASKNARRKEFLARVADAEADLRRSRLKLRANTCRVNADAGGMVDIIDWPVYEANIGCISETFHNLKDMEVRGGYLEDHFRGVSEELRADLKSLSCYLDGLRDEYRDVAMNAAQGRNASERAVPLTALPHVSRFMHAESAYADCMELLGNIRETMERYIAMKEKWRFSDSRAVVRREVAEIKRRHAASAGA